MYLPLGSVPLQTTLTGFVSYTEWDIQQVLKNCRVKMTHSVFHSLVPRALLSVNVPYLLHSLA